MFYTIKKTEYNAAPAYLNTSAGCVQYITDPAKIKKIDRWIKEAQKLKNNGVDLDPVDYINYMQAEEDYINDAGKRAALEWY